MADLYTLKFYRAYQHVTKVFEVEALDDTDFPAGRIEKGDIITIAVDSGTSKLTAKKAAAVAVDTILVTRDYPDYDIPLGRRVKHLQTPILTGAGEIVGIVLAKGDVIIKNDGTVTAL